MTYAVIKVFGVIVAFMGPAPFTMEECEQRIKRFNIPWEYEAEAYCVLNKPELGTLTDEQTKQLVEWGLKQEREKEQARKQERRFNQKWM